MMIDIKIDPRFTGSFAEVYTHMNPLTAGADLLWHTGTRAVYQVGDLRYVITGSGLTFASDGDGVLALTGGDVEAMTYRRGGVDMVTFATLQVTGDVLWAAFQSGLTNSDPAALTHLLAQHCWTYHGNGRNDYFPRSVVDTLGLLDPIGTDKVELGGGNDTFFTGSNTDTIYGGAGNDSLLGGTGRDALFGGAGRDHLILSTGDDTAEGGDGNDVIFGGAGADQIAGNVGADLINAGQGDDVVNGGAGADVFVFAAGDGADVIRGYQVGLDALHITDVAGYQVVDQGGDTLIVMGTAGSILLVGVQAALLSDADFI